MWDHALSLHPPPASVGVSTFNEWGEGTQIEPVRPWSVPEGEGISDSMRQGLGASKTFKDYGDLGPHGYLEITAAMARQLHETRKQYSRLTRADLEKEEL